MATTKVVTVKTLCEIRLVGFRVLCPGENYLTEIPLASEKLSRRIADIKNVIDPYTLIGAFIVENQTVDDDGYWICVEVKEFNDIPSDMVTLTIPAQKYAVVKFDGPNHDIRSAYKMLHSWAEENKYERAKDTWHLEKFYSWKDVHNIEVELFETIT